MQSSQLIHELPRGPAGGAAQARRPRSRHRGGGAAMRRRSCSAWRRGACGTIPIDAAYERIANHLPLQHSKE